MQYFQSQTPLSTPEEVLAKLPLSDEERKTVSTFRLTAEHIMRGEDDRLIIFAGPCSIHCPEIALEYAHRFKALSDKVSERIFMVMRVFLEKPRTQFGWKGFLYDPLLDGSYDIEKGLYASRKLLLELAALKVPVATEFLDPLLSPYTQDLITWGVIGARTSTSQIHRQMASHLSMPIGFKNETDGSLDNAICGALAARHPQASLGINGEGKVCSMKTSGNPYTHLILRGGEVASNYDEIAVSGAIQKQRLYGLSSRLLIDCAHGNSQKDPQKQQLAFCSTLEQIAEGNHLIMGAMLESHLQGRNALSMTDPCLDWETTEKLVLWAAGHPLSTSQSQLGQPTAAASTL
ncbi:Phospho-2-dehydro-3-deoxyheptonate aldolase, Tyr-sensitive [Candidatus Neptunochlamydia vexilliferae]|uniref:Phospho-2-dehydro-3-deoxyheptonate aldolase n=2 Tax=Candidatus Neptunichlamydia vexilliferae TaxID=1651774 RepID=A0ABS0B310_9BACT|nr:Phospho-2-dehydro-3-deoxyheptonate aldolase, Tyr-sensitive [Candidatus Neptunochlamydia vexilliferae]